MSTTKIAILGAGGIGKFHVREFARAGAVVTAILGTTEKTVERAIDVLHAEYGVRSNGYVELEDLVEKERVDAVSICTPPALHYEQAKKCLEAGCHVLCEKPFVFNSFADNSRHAIELIELAKTRGRIITVNTQWPSMIPYIEPYIDRSVISEFSLHSQPGAHGGEMFSDHVPHANSLLVALIRGGRAHRVRFSVRSEDEIRCDFQYETDNATCDVTYAFTFKADRPRGLGFSVNGVTFDREVGQGYSQKLITGGTAIAIEDPFKVQIEKFVRAIEGKGSVLIPTDEIRENMQLHDALAGAYASD